MTALQYGRDGRYARSPRTGEPQWMVDQAKRIADLAVEARPYAERDRSEQIMLGGNPGFYDDQWVSVQASLYATEAHRRMKTIEQVAGPIRSHERELVEVATCGRHAMAAVAGRKAA
jgi:hypothetical protein